MELLLPAMAVKMIVALLSASTCTSRAARSATEDGSSLALEGSVESVGVAAARGIRSFAAPVCCYCESTEQYALGERGKCGSALDGCRKGITGFFKMKDHCEVGEDWQIENRLQVAESLCSDERKRNKAFRKEWKEGKPVSYEECLSRREVMMCEQFHNRCKRSGDYTAASSDGDCGCIDDVD